MRKQLTLKLKNQDFLNVKATKKFDFKKIKEKENDIQAEIDKEIIA